jgi:hypothetical protein
MSAHANWIVSDFAARMRGFSTGANNLLRFEGVREEQQTRPALTVG